MFRSMETSELAATAQRWAALRGEEPGFAEDAIRRFAGEENVCLSEADGEIEALVLAVPVSLRGAPGCCLYGLAGGDENTAAGLVDYACTRAARQGAQFVVTAPSGAGQAELYAQRGFARAFALRCLTREVRRNLWSRAEFDAVTARKLCELRAQFCPDSVTFTPGQMAFVLGDLYARGATIVANPKGYGIYFRREETLYFIELMAEDDRAAEVLMEAAREKEVVVEKAVVTVGAAQPLFLGEGTRQDYGMIRFFSAPPLPDVSESYMQLMMG